MKVVFNNILCATDLSEFSNPAISYGIAMAREFSARLYLCHIIDLPAVSIHGAAYAFPEDYIEGLKTRAGEIIDSLMGGQKIGWEPLITTGPIAGTIADLVEEKGIDLAITATHGRSGLKRFILGSVTERLMRTINCPFLIVRSAETLPGAEAIQEMAFKSILVGCDFSMDSDSAVHYGLSLAQEFQSELHLAHVIETETYEDIHAIAPKEKSVEANIGEELKRDLANLVPEEARHWCDIKTICLAGKPYEELLKYAALNAIDLIVLGVRGHGLVETLFLGSTTDRVSRRSACPVLSVCPLE
jgi:nucleotide-binding universal stress UspA family protein